jgi:hypothetical protein
MAAVLVLAVACKTDPPKTDQAPAATDPGAKARSAKIDVKPVTPPPEVPASATGSDATREQRPPRDATKPDWSTRRTRLDTDGDGMISDEERAAATRERMGALRQRLDRDGDGKVSVEELSAARGRMKFDDPASLDTNHDGDISAEELAAALRARRAARRGSADAPAQ